MNTAPPRARLPSPSGRGAGGEGGLAPRAIAWLFCALSLAAAATTARADGEVGLVIEEDGQVRTFCVAYSGASISGDDLLSAAGVAYEDLGTSAGSVLCSIEDTGCFDAGSYDQCWCKCTGSGGSNCVYWAFFTRDYPGPWAYSTRAFDRTSSNDGDLHAWRWGQGGANSAPRPSDSLTFESLCGHAPRGGVAPTQPATSTSVSTAPPASAVPASGSENSTVAPGSTVTQTSALTPQVSVTFTDASPQATPLAPSTARRRDRDEAGGERSLLAFGVLVVLLLGVIGGAAYWRRTHGS